MLVEIAIAARNLLQAKEGDIVVARLPKGGCGREETRDFLWLLIDTDIPLNALRSHLTEDNPSRPGEPTHLERHRYQVQINSLVARIPGFNPSRARDPDDDYQVHFDRGADGGAVIKPNQIPLTLDPVEKTRTPR